MSASKKAKQLGAKSISSIARQIGRPRNLLENWYKSYPELFESVIIGCVEIKKRELEIKDGM